MTTQVVPSADEADEHSAIDAHFQHWSHVTWARILSAWRDAATTLKAQDPMVEPTAPFPPRGSNHSSGLPRSFSVNCGICYAAVATSVPCWSSKSQRPMAATSSRFMLSAVGTLTGMSSATVRRQYAVPSAVSIGCSSCCGHSSGSRAMSSCEPDAWMPAEAAIFPDDAATAGRTSLAGRAA